MDLEDVGFAPHELHLTFEVERLGSNDRPIEAMAVATWPPEHAKHRVAWWTVFRNPDSYMLDWNLLSGVSSEAAGISSLARELWNVEEHDLLFQFATRQSMSTFWKARRFYRQKTEIAPVDTDKQVLTAAPGFGRF